MKKKLFVVCLISSIIQYNTHSQVKWKAENVILKGKILNFENHKNHSTITFIFRDIIKRELQNKFVAKLGDLGKFELKVPINISTGFLCDLWQLVNPLMFVPETA